MPINDHIKRIKIFIKDPNKKSYITILKEVMSLWVFKKRFPIHYFGRFLYRKHILNSKDFLDMREYYAIIKSKHLNIPEYIPFLENKLVFSLLCEKYDINTPKVISYNFNNQFFKSELECNINNKELLYDFFNNQFSSSNVDKIFVKSLCGYGGKGSFCLKKLDLKKEVEKHYDMLIKGQYVHQLGVRQHDDINKIYSESVNTIRIDTYIDNNNVVHILAAVMRFGTGGSSLDNVSSGGFFVGINKIEGTLMEYSLQAMIYGGKRYVKHPDTNFTFNNFKIPFFEAAKDLCIKLTKYIPNRLAGWDIAITPDGPIVIEGNHTPYILMGEFSLGGYLNHPLYNEIILNTDL